VLPILSLLAVELATNPYGNSRFRISTAWYHTFSPVSNVNRGCVKAYRLVPPALISLLAAELATNPYGNSSFSVRILEELLE
jgi:hypothetical protein